MIRNESEWSVRWSSVSKPSLQVNHQWNSAGPGLHLTAHVKANDSGVRYIVGSKQTGCFVHSLYIVYNLNVDVT